MKERNQRCRRIGDQLKVEISAMLQREIKDPRIGFITVQDVEVAPDLSQAFVYYTVLGNAEEKDATLVGLNSTAGFMRREIGRRLHLKRIPEMQFRYDDSIDKGEHLEEVFGRIRKEERSEQSD
ncbi:MAG: 30S ribosome-binding factor RbfA [Deltaproteobacteria bacterium]|nr:30S ribosome-binding factor RbfA [Deltaproteobacteria bacterium]